jgi:hypothetical protein
MSFILGMKPLAGRLLFNVALASGLVVADALLHTPVGLLAGRRLP